MRDPEASIEHYLAQSRLKFSTRNAYRISLRKFEIWCADGDLRVEAVTPSDVARWMQQLRDHGSAESTVTNIFYAVKGFFGWLVSQGVIHGSPMSDLNATRSVQGPPESVSVDDLRKLLAVAGSEKNWALIAILAFSSLKVSELLRCDVSSLDASGGISRLHFEPLSVENRIPFTVLATEVAVVLQKQLAGRKAGPLFLNRKGKRMARAGATAVLSSASKRAALGFVATPQMLAYTLPVTALELGFSMVSVVRACGVPQPRHASPWLLHATAAPAEQNASIQLTRLVLQPPNSSLNLLLHVESLLHQTNLPEPFAVMSAVSVMERHLRLLCLEQDIRVVEDGSKGSINKHVDELRRIGLVDLPDKHTFSALADLRNSAAHGWFDRVPRGSGLSTLRKVGELIGRYPLANNDVMKP